MARLAVNIFLLLLYGATSSFGLLLLKQALGQGGLTWRGLAHSPAGIRLAAGAVLYVVSFLIWLRVLSRLPLTVAYPVAIGITLALTMTLSVTMLHERLGPSRLLGMALVMSGAMLLLRSQP